MILRRMQVQGVRCFRNPVEIGPLCDGINIIFAPNESGKSTLVDAVARALFDRYTARGEKLEGMRPWGTTLCPQIALDFEAQGKSYRLLKRLLDGQDSQLFDCAGDRLDLLHEREQADDFLRELMAADESKRGATQPKHWGVARMLWSLQGPGNDPYLEVPDAVAQQLRRALPNCAVPGRTTLTALLAQIEARHAVHFTETGRVKKGAPLQVLEQNITQLEQQRTQAQDAYANAELAAADIARIERELAALQCEQQEQSQKVTQLQDAVTQLAALRVTAELLGKDAAQAEKDYDVAAGARARYAEASTAYNAMHGDLQRLTRDRDMASTARKAAEMLLAEARDAQATAAEQRRTADTERQHGRLVNEALGLIKMLDALADNIARLSALSQQLQEREQRLRETPCPATDEIARVRQLATEAVRLRTQLMAVGLSAVIEAESAQQIELQDADGAPVCRQLPAETMEKFLTGSTLSIRLPGIARILVTSGSAEPAELSTELTRVQTLIQEILSRFGVADEAALAVNREEWLQLEREVIALRKEITAYAAPHVDVAAVSDAIANTTRELAIRCNQLHLTLDDTRRLAPAELDRLEAAYRATDAESEKLRLQLEARVQQYEQHRQSEEATIVQMQAQQADLTRLDAEMKAALSSMGCRDIAELTALVAELVAKQQVSAAKLAAVIAQLPASGTGPDAQLATTRAAIDDITAREHALDSQRMRAGVEIDHAQVEGRYERLAELEEQLESKRTELARLRHDAQAIRLLRHVVQTCREAVTAGQLPEVEHAVSRMLQAITGKSRAIAMSANFTVDSIGDDRIPRGHSADELSAGTREQLDLVMRIALGEAYAREYGRAMMVLDDALLYTDPVRHDRVKEIIKIAAQHLQIFIFTSHPERYRGITPLDYQFDLAQLAMSAREMAPS